MGEVISIVNQKGGVGKTTTAINLAACLAEKGKEVLLVDIDPQGNATTGLGIRKRQVSPTLYEVIANKATLEAAIKPTEIPHLSLIPANNELVGAERLLMERANSATVVRSIIQPLVDRYDFVFLDCPPSLGMLTVNGITACHSLIIPVQAEFYGLEGLTDLLQSCKLLKSRYNPNLRFRGILLTMYDARTNLAQEVEAEMRKFFGKYMFKTVIPRNIRLGEAPSFGKPAVLCYPSSSGSQAYRQLAEEVLVNEATGVG